MINRDATRSCGHRARRHPERRVERRLLCSDLMELRWAAPSGAPQCEMAIIEDFSSGGASLFLGVPVPPMTSVVLEAGERAFAGVVRYCSPQPNGYIAGVEFDRASGGEEYIPEHTLDLERLDFTPEES